MSFDGLKIGLKALFQCLRARSSWQGWMQSLFLLTVAIGAVAHAQRYAGITIDDAFITFRHSLNLIKGYGFTCNPGERIEGTASPFYTLLMVVPIVLGADPYRAATAIAQLSFAACTVVAYWSVRTCIRDRSSYLLAMGAALLVAASPTLAFHSQTGMETVPYAFLVSLALFLHYRSVLNHQPSRIWVWVLGAAALTRSEGFLLFLSLWALALIQRRSRPYASEFARNELTVFSTIFGLWLLFRFAYFGEWIPHSVQANSDTLSRYFAMSWRQTLQAWTHGPGTDTLARYFNEHTFLLLVTVGCLLLRRTRYFSVMVAAVVFEQTLFVTWNGNDWMPHDRLFCSAVTPLIIASVLGLRGFLFHPKQRTWKTHLPSSAIALLAFTYGLNTTFRPLPTTRAMFVDTRKTREIGRRLAKTLRSDDLVASELAGKLAYYWGAPTLDLMGHCGVHVDRSRNSPLNITKQVAPEYVVTKKPTFFVFRDVGTAADFYAKPEFEPLRNHYFVAQFPRDYLYQISAIAPPCLFVSKSRPDVAGVSKALNVRLVDAAQELRRIGFSLP
jgi:hypothetical protein